MVIQLSQLSLSLHSLRCKGHEGRLRRRRLEVPDVDGAEPVPSRMLGVKSYLVERMRDEATRHLISRQKLAGQLQSSLELVSKTPVKVEFEPLSTVSPKLLETKLQHDFSSTFQVVFATLFGENANTQLEVT